MTAGAVLCGGASRRMGTDKAVVEVGGVAMAERVASALEAAGCDPVVLVGGDPVRLGPLGRQLIADRFPGAGPAGGVLTALGAVDDEEVVVAACDLPLLRAATVRLLLDAAAAAPDAGVVAAATDRLEPGLAVWRTRAQPDLEREWAAGERALHRMIHAVDAVVVGVDRADLRNVNTMDERSAAERSVH